MTLRHIGWYDNINVPLWNSLYTVSPFIQLKCNIYINLYPSFSRYVNTNTRNKGGGRYLFTLEHDLQLDVGQGLRLENLSRGTVKTPEKAAVDCVWSLTTTVCSVPVLPGERVYAQSFAVPGVAGIVTVESISHSVRVEPTAVVPECLGHEWSRSLSWRLFWAFCSRGQAGMLLGSWMGRSLRKTVGSWSSISPSGSKLPLLTWALVLGMEGDHGCLSRLQPLGH